MTRQKIINDPVYGFITLNNEKIYRLIEHPYFQRLRRIRQLGLTDLVYPGTLHTRFHHALGAMYLMGLSLDTLRKKGHKITFTEYEGALIAILLHDIGHGPFSHLLEPVLIQNVSHEDLSLMFMNRLNKEMKNGLKTGIAIFHNTYPKKFLHQLVSSQLDMDRLDYMMRDSYYSGVSEGIISVDRIIKMLNVKNNLLVVEQNGIYSIEKFLIARRLMYWQVYLHKTVISSGELLVNILLRVKELLKKGFKVDCSTALMFFLQNTILKKDFEKDKGLLSTFADLDDIDVLAGVKNWINHPDPTLSQLSKNLIHRHLYKIEFSDKKIPSSRIKLLKRKILKQYSIKEDVLKYYVFTNTIRRYAYINEGDPIRILMKDGRLEEITESKDILTSKALLKKEVKYFLCYMR